MGYLEKKELNNVLIAFACTFGLQILAGITVRNPLTLVFFFVFLAMGRKIRKNGKKKLIIPVFVLSGLFSVGLTFLFGRGAVTRFDSTLFKLLGMGIMLVGLFFSCFRVLQLILGIGNPGGKGAYKKEDAVMSPGKLPGGVYAAICFLCWLPYFLYEYPGIMTADSIVQYEQIIGVNPLSNHHPVIHTMVIGFFYNIGMMITHEANRAISFYVIAQMVFLAFCCSRVILQVRKVTGDFRWEIFSLAFFALVPFNAVFSVTVWKDVPFAGIVMLMGCEILSMAEKESLKISDFVRLSVLSVLMALFRSNGWYAFLLSAAFIIYAFRRDLGKIIITVVASIVVVVVIKGPVMNAAGVIQPDFTESLSLPLQQIARVLTSDERIEDSDMELIEAVIDTTYIHELYAPDFADNIKELVRAGHPEVIEADKVGYLGLWVRLGLKYPLHYIRAWFDLEGGYVYPDVAYDVGNIDGIMGNDYGLVHSPLIGGKAVVKGKEVLIKLGSFVPLYGMLWCAGFYTWLVAALLILMIMKKWNGAGGLLPFVILQAALIGTLLIAAPMVDFRYEYAPVMLMPLTAAFCAMIVRDAKISRH